MMALVPVENNAIGMALIHGAIHPWNCILPEVIYEAVYIQQNKFKMLKTSI